jgi:hypothetical protein
VRHVLAFLMQGLIVENRVLKFPGLLMQADRVPDMLWMSVVVMGGIAASLSPTLGT